MSVCRGEALFKRLLLGFCVMLHWEFKKKGTLVGYGPPGNVCTALKAHLVDFRTI